MDISVLVFLSKLPPSSMKRLLIGIGRPFNMVVLCALPMKADIRVKISRQIAESMSSNVFATDVLSSEYFVH